MKNLKLILALFLFTQIIFAQERKVTGTVVDKYGKPIPGATIAINKTHNGTQTDFDGKYSLKVSLKDTLVFSLAGMKTKKIKVDKEEINIELEEVELKEEIGPPYNPKTKRLEATTIVSKEDIEKADNPKYNFKKNTKKNVFVIFVSELTSYNLNKEDLQLQQKYNVKYSLIGSYKTII